MLKTFKKLTLKRDTIANLGTASLRHVCGAAIASDDASCTGPCSGGLCGTDSCGGSCGCTLWTERCTTITIVPCAP